MPVGAVRPDQGGVAGEGDEEAEIVVRGAGARRQLRLHGPSGAAAREDVDRALTGVAAYGVVGRCNQSCVAGDVERFAKVVTGAAVARGQRRLQGPGAAGPHVDVGGALSGVAAHRLRRGPNQGGVSGQGHPIAKLVASSVACELRLLNGRQSQRSGGRGSRLSQGRGRGCECHEQDDEQTPIPGQALAPHDVPSPTHDPFA